MVQYSTWTSAFQDKMDNAKDSDFLKEVLWKQELEFITRLSEGHLMVT